MRLFIAVILTLLYIIGMCLAPFLDVIINDRRRERELEEIEKKRKNKEQDG